MLGLTASDQVSALEADNPLMCQGVSSERFIGLRSNFAEVVLAHGEAIS
jgi:hypothetical protein